MSSNAGPNRDVFATTQWSLVSAAGKKPSPQAREALGELCSAYWFPLYAYVRRRVSDVEEAQDLTQAFFARLLEKETLAAARRERGRFRAFLITAFKNFLANEWEKARSKKRGGGKSPLALDFHRGESRLRHEPAYGETPERHYERQWALTLLDRVLARLRERYATAGKQRQFETLKQFLTGAADISYADAARELGKSENAAKTAAHRLRKEYRALLHEEIAQTVSSTQDVEDEIHALFRAVGG